MAQHQDQQAEHPTTQSPDSKQKPSFREKPRRLGRGLSALVGSAPVSVPVPAAVPTRDPTHESASASTSDERPAAGSVREQADSIPSSTTSIASLVSITSIRPNESQPRVRFDQTPLDALADSIARDGILQPLIVRRRTPGEYELIAGERRLRAAKQAGLEQVPVVVMETDDRGSAELALVENLLREDLDPIERAEGLRGLIDRYGFTQQEAGKRVGMDRSSVANLLRLLELEPSIRDRLIAGELTLGHGKALLSAAPGEQRTALADRAVREGLSVRALELAVKQVTGAAQPKAPSEPAAPAVSSPALADLERQLGAHLGTKVRVKTTGANHRGKLEIDFYSIEHFDGLVAHMGFVLSDE